MKNNYTKQRTKENPPEKWLPEACRFAVILKTNRIKYAIFGAGSLAAHKIITRPTIDIDFVVEDFAGAIKLVQNEPNLDSKNLQKDKDGISVADFHFKSSISVQIWDGNLYSLPMNTLSWSKINIRNIPGYGDLWTISIEDTIVSKVGRFRQQKDENEKEADKNIRDILSTISVLKRPDYRYIIERLKEGARRESSVSSRIHSLDWFFVREIEIYREKIRGFDFERVSQFVSNIVKLIKSREVEYYLLDSLRKVVSLKKFQQKFMLNDRCMDDLLLKWKFINIDGDKVILTSKSIQGYVNTLPERMKSNYYMQLLYSGKKVSK